MDPNQKCARCGTPGRKICPGCKGQTEWVTEAWELDPKRTYLADVPEFPCGGCGKTIPEGETTIEVRQELHVWKGGKNPKRVPVQGRQSVSGFACSIECGQAVDTKLTLMRSGKAGA